MHSPRAIVSLRTGEKRKLYIIILYIRDRFDELLTTQIM